MIESTPELVEAETPQPELAPQVNVLGAVVVGPGGRPMVGLELHYGLSQHTLVMDPHTAEQLGPIIAGVLAQVVPDARRAAAGLVIAGPDDLKNLILPPNGR